MGLTWRIILVAALVGSGCSTERESGGPTAGVDDPPTVSTTTTDSVVSVPVTVAAGEWVTIEPSFETDGFLVTPLNPDAEVDAVGSAAGFNWAAGSLAGHPTIWRSEDLNEFRVVYVDDWSVGRRWIDSWQILEFDGKVLIGGVGRNADERQLSFLFVSDDGGDTWSEIDEPLLSGPFVRVVSMFVADHALVVSAVSKRSATVHKPIWIPARTLDLESWEPIVLPDAPAGTNAYFVAEPTGTLWAVDQRAPDPDRMIVWTSHDGGGSWSRATTDRFMARGAIAAGGSLVFLPDMAQYGIGRTQSTRPQPLMRFTEGNWVPLAIDVGQWGDGNVRMQGVNDPRTGRFYGAATRVIRASPHYCFVDVESCAKTETVFVTSDDGIAWFDVAGGQPEVRWNTSFFFTAEGRIAVRTPAIVDYHAPLAVLTVWTGDQPPPTSNPPGYPPPDVPIPMYDPDEGLPVGMQRRIQWGLGWCPGMYVDGIVWTPDEMPDTTGWPLRDPQIADGPTALAYGRVDRVAENLIRFSIENTDMSVVLTPSTDDSRSVCG